MPTLSMLWCHYRMELYVVVFFYCSIHYYFVKWLRLQRTRYFRWVQQQTSLVWTVVQVTKTLNLFMVVWAPFLIPITKMLLLFLYIFPLHKHY